MTALDAPTPVAIRRPTRLAGALASRARALRRAAADAYAEELARGAGPLLALRPGLSASAVPLAGPAFADAFAQTLAYGLWAARWWSHARAPRFVRAEVPGLLPTTTPALAGLFARMLAPWPHRGLDAAVDAVVELLDATDVAGAFAGAADPAVHFYEQFLGAYDPGLRRRRGVYFTPDEVVACAVESAHAALQRRFGLRLGLADAATWGEVAGGRVPAGVDAGAAFVQVLDPAAGTGAFLVGVVEVVHRTMAAEYARAGLDPAQRAAAWAAYVRGCLLPRVHGLEILAAPYVVCHLRLGLALARTGFVFAGDERLRVRLGDALAEDDARRDAPITVIVGNPPYARAAGGPGGRITDGARGRAPIDEFDAVTRAAGAAASLQATRNVYYYFWRWATWRLEARAGLGVVALVTASSFLRGPGFAGMRAHLRAHYDEVRVLDLEGDQRGTRVSDNVFAIQIPVCVTLLVRGAERGAPEVRYLRAAGSRAEKLALCARGDLAALPGWAAVTGAATAPLVAGAAGRYERWPSVASVFPLRFTGLHFYRTWPVGVTAELLERRWRALVDAPVAARPALLKETRDRKAARTHAPLLGGAAPPAIAALPPGSPCPPPVRTSFRSFDRQWCIADTRVGDFLRPALWRTWGPAQTYFTSLLSGVLGPGPGATAAAYVPDCHHFRGSFGGKDVVPLWRDAAGREPNLDAQISAALTAAHGRAPGPDEVFAYAYAVLANPGYVRRFAEPLRVPGPRLPLSRDRDLFARGAALGRELLRWHTYGERFREPGDGFALHGAAAVRAAPSAVPADHAYDAARQLLRVGDGEVGPVSPAAYAFAVSGLPVVRAWLDARTGAGAGRRSSPLDALRPARWTAAMSGELLELLWVVEWTLAQHPALDRWLDEVLAGESLEVAAAAR
jgi:hypothetical protein